MTVLLKITSALAVVVLTVVSLQASGPTSTAIDVNSRLQNLYLDLLAKESKPIALSADLDELNLNLARLKDLDSSIRALGPGKGDAHLRMQANIYRAMAWLHGWATFSRLALESGTPSSPAEIRDRLLRVDANSGKPSALSLLLTVYHHIQREDGTTEPLRHILQDGTLFVLMLSYHEPWRVSDRRPANIAHDYYIPSAADIVGASASPPVIDRHLIPLWGLVNLELDRWQTLASEELNPTSAAALAGHPLTIHRLDGAAYRLQANIVNLSPLIAWLTDVAAHPDLPSLEPGGATFVSGLQVRLRKIALFLKVRQDCSDERKLSDIVARLRTTTQRTANDPTPVLADLISAATPVAEGGTKEVLYDAAIWLRYLMLLAYANQGQTAVGSGSNALRAVWARYKLPESFILTPNSASTVAVGGSFLRWNQWPASGTAAALLSDLTRATYAYLEFQHAVSSKEDTRFQSLGTRQAQTQYSQSLDQALQSLSRDSTALLSPYFPPSSAAHSATSVAADALSDPDGVLAYPFRFTSTSREQTRWIDDCSALYSHVLADTSFNTLVTSAYKTSDPVRISGALQLIGGIVPTAEWNIYSLPRKTFSEYSAQLENALKPLDHEIKEAEARDELRSLFHERQLNYENARTAAAAARLGREVATMALAIDQTYQKIADLDTQIGDLTTKINDIDIQGAKSQEQAAALRLQYTTRLRDLVAAKVEALVTASEQASEMIQKATSDLENLKPKLLQTATEIKAQKDHAGFMSLINSVVTVVGVALAPFTGGSSIAIATYVNQAVKVFDKASHANWSDLPTALATVKEVGDVLSQGLKLASVPTPAALQGAIGDCNKFFGSAKASLDKLSAEAQNIIASIKALPSTDQINRYVAGLASGFPVVIDSNTVRVNFSKDSIEIASPALKAAVNKVIDSGGMIVNDARSRAERFSGLLNLSGPDLTEQLKKSIDVLIQPFPDSFPLPSSVTGTVEDAKKAFRDVVDQLDAAGQSSLAKMLANGMIFVRADDNRVLAVQNAVNGDLEKFKERLHKYEERVRSKALDDVSKDINAITSEINSQTQQMAANNDDDALAKYATDTLPGKIKDLQTNLKKVQDQIDVAQGELEDKTTEVSIASYDADAYRYFLQSAELRGEEAALQARKAAFSRDASAAAIEEAGLELQRQNALVEIAVRGEEIARSSMQRTYLQCLSRGLNPLVPPATEGVDYQYNVLSLRSLIAGPADAANIHSDLAYAAAAGDLAGMMQWVYMLRVSAPRGSASVTLLFLTTINALQQRNPSALKKAGADLQAEFSKAAASSVFVRWDRALNLDQEIVWFDNLNEAAKSQWLDPLSGLFSPAELKTVLGGVQISFSLDARGRGKTIHVPASLGNSSYYMKLENASVVVPNVDTHNLDFILLPPPNPMSNSNELMAGLSAADSAYFKIHHQISSDLSEVVLQDQIEKQLSEWQSLHLSGSIGTWTFYILSSTTPDDLDNLKRQWKMTIRMPYLEVQHAVR